MQVKRFDSSRLEKKLATLRIIGMVLFILLLILTILNYLNVDGRWGGVQSFTNILLPFLGLAMSYSGHYRLQKVRGSYVQFEADRLRFQIEQSEHSLAVPEGIQQITQGNKEVKLTDAEGKIHRIPYDVFGNREVREQIEAGFARIEALRQSN